MPRYRFSVVGNSDFNLLARFDAGEDIVPVLEQRTTVGFNSPRVWTAFDIPLIGRLIPSERPELYAKIPAFMALCGQYAQYPEITAFTGPYGSLFPTDDDKVAHWDNLQVAVAHCTNLLDLELVNEGENEPNRNLPWARLRRPTGAYLSSHGSNLMDATPIEPPWSVTGYRPPGNEWQRKVGHNAMEWAVSWNIPCWSNETTRMPDRDADPRHAFDAAAGAALLCAGATFHSPQGKDSTLWTGQALVCAQAWADGAHSVPLEFQAGQYSRRENPSDDVLRVYRRTLPDGRYHEVQIHA